MTCTEIVNLANENIRIAWPYFEWIFGWIATIALFGAGVGLSAFSTLIILCGLYDEGSLDRWLKDKHKRFKPAVRSSPSPNA